MKVFDVLRDSWFFFRHNLFDIIVLCLPWLLLETLARRQLQGLGESNAAVLYDVLISLLCYPLYSGALILFLEARSNAEQPAKLALLSASLRLWPRFVLLAGISTLAIVFGAALFILPGLWVMVRLIFADYLLVLRGLSPLQAMQQSLQLTRGHFWPILSCVLLVMAPISLFSFWAGSVAGDGVARLLLDALLGLCPLFTTVLLFRLYMLRTADGMRDE
ncbi:YciC family protein [Phytopseudomonas dryadis]|uniref:Uncharacterized protein n=1 Tax=Phytopseudomonas dryadis TaxID=2487520 RepID=A0A4Q9QZ98_9GAMM|nr:MULTISPECIES: YciC family protein [Pseudomonas]TBU90935.1 hypothetical protein DNK44_14865 [Pseudomonas dryadis]TBV08910.1 hypothetical protein DNK34_02980 [Pseudomonas dryadis]TBV15095.1 hypothetical protein DNK41_18540 [Pseudomonas sp. FRB 230]